MALPNDAPEVARAPGGDPRTRASRLAAVQALYEIEIADVSDLGPVLEDYMARRWRDEDFQEGDARHPAETAAEDASENAPGGKPGPLARPRHGLLDEIVRGTRAELADVDAAIAGAVTRSGGVAGLEALLRNILRAAVFELMKRPHVPARVCIDEYVSLAGSFYDSREENLVNGILNTLARRLRPAEFDAAAGTGPGEP